jgi:hypothetical protein
MSKNISPQYVKGSFYYVGLDNTLLLNYSAGSSLVYVVLRSCFREAAAEGRNYLIYDSNLYDALLQCLMYYLF